MTQEPTLHYDSGQFYLRDHGKLKKVSNEKAMTLKRFAAPVLKRYFQAHYELPETIKFTTEIKLDPHQESGIEWILSRRRSYLNHAPGAGKTLQALVASVWTAFVGQTLFIVPPTLVENWTKELYQWFWKIDANAFPSVVTVPESSKQESVAWGSDYIICPDSMITKDWVLENLADKPYKLVGVDEASRFKDPRSQRSIALFGGLLKGQKPTRGIMRQAKHFVLLDGSPAPTEAMDLWGPTFAACPEAIDFMDETEFGIRFCVTKIDDRGRYEFKFSKNEKELRERLRKDFMHIIGEDELSHPERIRKLILTGDGLLSKKQKAWEVENIPFQKGADLLSEVTEEMSRGELAKHRQEIGMAKVPFVIKYVKEKMEKGEPILVFAWHREVAYALKTGLAKFNPGLVIGGVHQKKRYQAFERFQNGKTDLLIGNILAMGRGQNLQRAKRVVFAEISWSDEVNKQAEKRASRKGALQKFVRSDYIVASNTFDETVFRSVFRKEEMGRKLFR